ncbi:MAG: M20/M25/M40 family metallo-hydrolase [Candidatus Acidiferrales bacterium]
MDLFALTRSLIDIESITLNENSVGQFLLGLLTEMGRAHSGIVERLDVKENRFNVFAKWGEPIVTLSTHMDTVPPFIPSREDSDFIWGRGACDAKGIIASMIAAAESLLQAGVRKFGILFVVGEERDSAGAMAAANTPRGSRYLINGEPTENKLALGCKGSLRYELTARGKMAHSAYPELGRSAIEILLDVLQDVRGISLPEDSMLGRSTLNIGTISGGRAPNVIPDFARAELMFRLAGDAAPVSEAVSRAVAGRAEIKQVLQTPVVRMGALDGLPSTVVSYTTDIPFLAGPWGKPYLFGPGSAHVAHTEEERISKQEMREAVEIYKRMVKTLLADSQGKS